MKPLKIFLCDLTYDTTTLSTEAFPLNVGYIASYAKQLFGDDVEQDALIYLSYQLILNGQLQWKDVKKLMREGGALSSAIDRMRRSFSQLKPNNNVVRGIFIRLTKHQIPSWMYDLMPHLIPVHTWSQAGVKLWSDAVISIETLTQICADEGTTPVQLANLVQDLQLRGLIAKEKAVELLNLMGNHHRYFFEAVAFTPLTFTDVFEAFREVS